MLSATDSNSVCVFPDACMRGGGDPCALQCMTAGAAHNPEDMYSRYVLTCQGPGPGQARVCCRGVGCPQADMLFDWPLKDEWAQPMGAGPSWGEGRFSLQHNTTPFLRGHMANTLVTKVPNRGPAAGRCGHQIGPREPHRQAFRCGFGDLEGVLSMLALAATGCEDAIECCAALRSLPLS